MTSQGLTLDACACCACSRLHDVGAIRQTRAVFAHAGSHGGVLVKLQLFHVGNNGLVLSKPAAVHVCTPL
jgi:hypothetical protein